MTRFGTWGLVSLVVIVLPVLAAHWPVPVEEEAQPALLLLLPEPEELECWNWSAMEDTLTFCPTPDSLTDIYNGGYEYYVEAGVQQALVQAYEAEEDFFLVYVHEMASIEQAEAICADVYESLDDGSDALVILEPEEAEEPREPEEAEEPREPEEAEETVSGGFLYVGGGQISAYIWHDRFYCNIVALGEEEEQVTSVTEFAQLLDRRIALFLGEDEEDAEE